MKTLFRLIGKLLKALAKIAAVAAPILFVVYMWNLDMKAVGWLYETLNKFHDRKPRDVQF